MGGSQASSDAALATRRSKQKKKKKMKDEEDEGKWSQATRKVACKIGAGVGASRGAHRLRRCPTGVGWQPRQQRRRSDEMARAPCKRTDAKTKGEKRKTKARRCGSRVRLSQRTSFVTASGSSWAANSFLQKSWSDKDVRLAQNMRVGPRIPVGMQRSRAAVGPASAPARRRSHLDPGLAQVVLLRGLPHRRVLVVRASAGPVGVADAQPPGGGRGRASRSADRCARHAQLVLPADDALGAIGPTFRERE
jgi:hypothetical protein